MKYLGTISDSKDLVNKEYVDDGLEVKANVDGAYEDMTVGNAEQLISTVFVNDQVPYTFRTSGGSADIGDREYDTLVGGTIAWNQMVQNGNFSDGTNKWSGTSCTLSASDGVLTLTAPASPSHNYMRAMQSITLLTSHVYYFSAVFDATQVGGFNNFSFRLLGDTNAYVGVTEDTQGAYQKIYQAPYDFTSVGPVFTATSSTTIADTAGTVSNVQILDLTLMFGSTIADYIYTLEQNNPGDGVAWVTKYFPKLNGGYYPYNAGELLSVSGVSAHNMTGLNQWDEEWEVGAYDTSTGAKISSTTKIRSKNPISIVPSTTYYYYNGAGEATQKFFYDVNGNYITNLASQSGTTFVTPANAYYMTISPAATYGTTYNNDICISLYWDGEMEDTYEPYTLNSHPLDSSLTLRGIPELDADNKLRYDGDIYAADGTVTRKYGIVDLGTLNWSWSSTNTENIYRMAATITGAKLPSTSNDLANIICSKYVAVTTTDTYRTVTGICLAPNGKVAVYDENYNTSSSVAAFKTAMSGVYLVYELDPSAYTTETADPFQSPQIVNDFGTEEYVTTAQSGVLVPVGHNTNYTNNLRAKLEMVPESPSGDGDYIVRQTNGQNAYVPLTFPVSDIPDFPTTDGTYTLQVVVSDGAATASWVSA